MPSLSTTGTQGQQSHAEVSCSHCLGKMDYHFFLCQILVFLRQTGNIHKYFNKNIVARLHSPGEPVWPRREAFWTSLQSRSSPWGARPSQVPWQLMPPDLWITELSRFITALPRTTGGKAKMMVQKSRSTILQLSFPLGTVKYWQKQWKIGSAPLTPQSLLYFACYQQMSAVNGGRAAKGKDSNTI